MTASPPRMAGLVIAGGRAVRFGSEKALAELDGRPLLAHVLDALARDCAVVGVNARPGSATAAWAQRQGFTLVADAPGAPDGPLSGVLAGLSWAETQGCALLATAPCDTPAIQAALKPGFN